MTLLQNRERRTLSEGLQDLLRLRVGDPRDCRSLRFFLADALQAGAHHANASDDGARLRKKYVYQESREEGDTKDAISKLECEVALPGPQITALSLSGSASLPELLPLLRGTLKAEYFHLEESPQLLQAQDQLKYAYAKHPLRGKRLIAAELAPQRSGRKSFFGKGLFSQAGGVVPQLQEISLSQATFSALQLAYAITVEYFNHIAENEQKDTLQEKTLLVKRPSGRWYWSYTVQNLAGHGLPAQEYQHWERLFQRLSFSQNIFQRRKENP